MARKPSSLERTLASLASRVVSKSGQRAVKSVADRIGIDSDLLSAVFLGVGASFARGKAASECRTTADAFLFTYVSKHAAEIAKRAKR